MMSADIRPEDWSVLDLVAPSSSLVTRHSQLLLTYTPPHLRNLRPPWEHDRAVDCFEDVDYTIDLHRFHYLEEVGPIGSVWPCLTVSNATAQNYADGTFEEYETRIWFKPHRMSFRAAYQLARILRKTSHALITEPAWMHYYAIDVGERHTVKVATKVVHWAEFEDPEAECQVCHCTDDSACAGGCSWANPQRTLCTRCLRQLLLLALESGVAL
jgi:hypothetical protein